MVGREKTRKENQCRIDLAVQAVGKTNLTSDRNAYLKLTGREWKAHADRTDRSTMFEAQALTQQGDGILFTC